MPATEQTWRDQKTMHVIFGVSSLLMLLTTIWMLAADHNREWKQYQRQMRSIDAWTLSAREAQVQNVAYRSGLEEQHARLESALAQGVAESDLQEFLGYVERAQQNGQAAQLESRKAIEEHGRALDRAVDGQDPARATGLRASLLSSLQAYIDDAKFRESNLQLARKNMSANLDVAKSELDILVGEDRPENRLQSKQREIDAIKKEVDGLTQKVQESTAYRKALQHIFDRITAEETAARKAIDDQRQVVNRIEEARRERQYSAAKKFVDLPVIDAFNAPSHIDQIWLPNLTIYNNFKDVARFDRCTTCHQAIDKTAQGSAVEPLYRAQRNVALDLPLPEAPSDEQRAKPLETLIEEQLGIQLAAEGVLRPEHVVVSVVRPASPAAKGGLQVGDRLLRVSAVDVELRRDLALTYLGGQTVAWGKPLAVLVRRGLPHPFASHPRLDLFVGSTSPHKMQDMGCTVCHDGQGSATAFKFASHTPNNPRQAADWSREHGWYNNHHWIFPMSPQRFAESNCLKCHHELMELEPSERFPDPPAPKLLEGFALIRQYGCFGCHEINGYDGPNKRIGPDLRVEPSFAFAAKALLRDKDLSDEERELAAAVVESPESDAARRTLVELIKTDLLAPAAEGGKAEPRLSAATRKLASLLEDVESPGKYRKVGPSLRHLASKVDYDFLYAWVRNPRDFRNSTKMPRFFGLHNHLSDEEAVATRGLEAIEVRGITEFLLAKSQPFKYAATGRDTAPPSVTRGKELFETRGCLACHQHQDFPAGTMNQGPDLSNLGSKFAASVNKNGPRWLYTWLKHPNQYHPRTLMPNLLLEPIKSGDAGMIDPAADIAAYLLQAADWQPQDVPSREQLTDRERQDLDALALDHLEAATTKRLAREYLKNGIDERRRDEFRGDEVELLGDGMMDQKKLLYVGRRALSKYGCAGCHDIPGYEDAKPIGTGLADWGRKAADKLAFEQISEYVAQAHGSHGDGGHGDAGAEHDFAKQSDQDQAYFMEKLLGHERQGFIWQKLHEPRSYDYRKVANKRYNERLRMPKFNLTDHQIESIMTFVLGLVNEPPATQYVYKASSRRAAMVEGQKVLEKYNCGGCHVLKMDRWELAYDPSDFGDPTSAPDYNFVTPRLTAQQIKSSLEMDLRGLRHATLVGMPAYDPATGKPVVTDADRAELAEGDRGYYEFVPYENAVINGQLRPAGLQTLMVPLDRIAKQYPAVGGFLPRLIYSAVLERESRIDPTSRDRDKAPQAWGWLPPPLLNEGRKVQTDWLHDFLLDPQPIRPAAVLRMPKFNFSSGEATALVNYFAAVDNVGYPYEFDDRARDSHLQAAEAKHPGHLDDALKIVVDNSYCVKCHLVADYEPEGSDRPKGPRLDQVYHRLRPAYVRQWIANPKRLLPYTGMPVNVQPTEPLRQSLYAGSSIEQLDALVDLLMNFDRFAERQTSIRPLVKPVAAGEAASAQGPASRRSTDAGLVESGLVENGLVNSGLADSDPTADSEESP